MIYSGTNNEVLSKLVGVILGVMEECEIATIEFLEETMYESQEFKNIEENGLKLYANDHDGMQDIFEDKFELDIHEFGLAMYKSEKYSLDDEYIRYHSGKLESFNELEYKNLLMSEHYDIIREGIRVKGFDYIMNKLNGCILE